MNNNRDSSMFLKLMEKKCKNIKISIDSLLVELCKQLSLSNNQSQQEQFCNPNPTSAMQESKLEEQACPTESDRPNHIDPSHTKLRKKAPLVGRDDLMTGQKQCDRKLTTLKKEKVLNYSSDDKQYENAHLQFQSVEDQSINKINKLQTRPHTNEKDLVKNDTHNNLIVQTRYFDRNQDQLEIPQKFDSFLDDELIKNYRGQNKDKITNKNIDESNKNKSFKENQESNINKKQKQLKDYVEANKDKIKKYKEAYREANKDKIKKYKEAYREANKDKHRIQIKEYNEANKDKIRRINKNYREANKNQIKNLEKDYQEANKDKIRNQRKDYQEANKDKLRIQSKEYREANKDKIIERKNNTEANK